MCVMIKVVKVLGVGYWYVKLIKVNNKNSIKCII